MDEGLEGLVCRGRGRGINKGELEEHVERSIRVGGGGGGACLGGKGELLHRKVLCCCICHRKCI